MEASIPSETRVIICTAPWGLQDISILLLVSCTGVLVTTSDLHGDPGLAGR